MLCWFLSVPFVERSVQVHHTFYIHLKTDICWNLFLMWSRNPIKVRELRVLMDGVTNLEENLQELYTEVNRIIKEGDTATAREIVDANYEALLSQLGDEAAGIEQAAMLDILAQLRLSLGDYDEVEQLLAQVGEIRKYITYMI